MSGYREKGFSRPSPMVTGTLAPSCTFFAYGYAPYLSSPSCTCTLSLGARDSVQDASKRISSSSCAASPRDSHLSHLISLRLRRRTRKKANKGNTREIGRDAKQYRREKRCERSAGLSMTTSNFACTAYCVAEGEERYGAIRDEFSRNRPDP